MMNVLEALNYLVLGAFLGAVGQSIRVIVGLKKQIEKAAQSNKRWQEWFNASELVVSLIIGAVAGIVGAILLLGAQVDKQLLLTLVSVGYSGTDFIEGFMKLTLEKFTKSKERDN